MTVAAATVGWAFLPEVRCAMELLLFVPSLTKTHSDVYV